MRGEILQPAADQTLGDGLGADMHETPLIQMIILQLQLSAVQRGQDILGPGNQEPDDGAMLLGHRLQDRFRAGPLQNDGLAAGNEGAEPVHLGAGMIKRGDAEEAVVLRLAMMGLLHAGGMDQAAMLMQDCLREAGGAGGKINRGVIILSEFALWEDGAALVDELIEVIREGGAACAKVDQGDIGNLIRNFLHTADELRPEDHHIALGKIETVLDLIGGVTEIHGHREGTGFQNAEIDRKPVDTVHQENGDLAARADAVAFQHIGDAVGFFIKDSPGDLPAVMAAAAGGLDELEIMPGDPAGFRLIGINFNQSGIVRPVTGVPLQQMYNRQECSTSVSNTL